MPSRTRLCSAMRVSSSFLNLMLPPVARVLPQIRSSSVVLPAPLGPMITRSSFLSMYSVRSSMALKPSNDTVRSSMASAKSVLLMRSAPVASEALAAHAIRQRGCGWWACLRCLAQRSAPALPPGHHMALPQARQAHVEGHGHADEKPGHEEQPQLGKALREIRLARVHQQGAIRRAHQAHAPAHGGIDHHLDGWHDAYEAG